MKNKIFPLLIIPALFSQLNLHGLNPESPQAKKDQTPLRYEVTVALKLVQVYVTDKDGKSVTDLTRSDFIIYDNGKPQPITDFEKHLLIKPEKAVKPEKMFEEKITETKLPPSPEIASRMNRKFILLLDIDRNSMPGVAKSKRAALHFIDTQLEPTDEVGVFSYSFIRRLVVHQYLTSDHEKVKEAIKRIKEVPGNLSAGGGVITAGGEGLDAMPLSQPSAQGGDVVEKTNIFIEIIKELAKALRYIPGYKNIILFSGGVQDGLLVSPDQVLLKNYEDMSKELAASNTPVFTVNTAEVGRPLSLQMLSELSGGKYFHSVDYYQEIAKVIQNVTGNYYVLGYYVDEKWDGKYHEIKVEVKRKGCQVQAQGGYFNPKPFPELSEFEKQLHLIDLALSERPFFQEPSRFPLIALPCSNKKESSLVLLSEIRLDEIQETVRGKTEMITLILDKENSLVDSSRGEIDFLSIPQKRVYHYTLSSLEPGEYECRLVIRNLETGKGALASTRAVLAEPLESGLRLYPPLLLIPDKEAFYLKATKAQEKETGSKPLSLINLYPFLSNKHSPLVCDLDQGTSKLLAIVRCSVIGIQKPDIELSAHLIQHSSGEKSPLPFSILAAEHKEETSLLLLELDLPGLQPGSYGLEISAEETASGSKSQTARTFSVKSVLPHQKPSSSLHR